MPLIDFLQNLGIAFGLGCVIGLERQLTGHSMGIRTGILVSVGASLFTAFSFCVPSGDVTRMAAQVVSGVGFLGSGIIFKDGFNVRGINTAATIWCTAGIGVMAGAGLHLYALIATGCLTIVNIILRFVSNRMIRWRFTDDSGGTFSLTVTCSMERESEVRDKLVNLLSGKKTYLLTLGRKKIQNRSVLFETKFVYDGGDYTGYNEKIANELLQIESVCDVEWNVTD